MFEGYQTLDESEAVKWTRRRVAGIVALVLGVVIFAGHSASLQGPKSSSLDSTESTSSAACVNADASSPVLAGYDVVAFFKLDEGEDAILGSIDHSTVFNGYTFYFSTAENLELFKKSPSDYLPQWGAFCAYGVSSEKFWTWATVEMSGPAADPNTWLIKDGKLYLFMYEVPKRMFLTGNVDARIESGIETWSKWTDGDVHSYFNTGCFWWDEECGHEGDYCVPEYLSLDEDARESYQRPFPSWLAG